MFGARCKCCPEYRVPMPLMVVWVIKQESVLGLPADPARYRRQAETAIDLADRFAKARCFPSGGHPSSSVLAWEARDRKLTWKRRHQLDRSTLIMFSLPLEH